MPTYSYRCSECDHAFDIQQAFTDDSLTVCPECGGILRKVFGAIGVSFSGSGFYRTDSRADAKAAKDKTASGSAKPEKAVAKSESSASGSSSSSGNATSGSSSSGSGSSASSGTSSSKPAAT